MSGKNEDTLYRRKYVEAWNKTMVDIWRDRMSQYDVIDTGRLIESPLSITLSADGRFMSFELQSSFLEYGYWQDYGVGREVPRGNKGDIGRTKVRERRPWFSGSYFRSVHNLKEAMADSIGREFAGVISSAFDRGLFRQSLSYYRRNKRALPTS